MSPPLPDRPSRPRDPRRTAASAVSPDGKWIVSESADNTLKVREAETGEVRDTIRVDGRPIAVATGAGRVWVACANSTICGYDFSP